MTDTNLKYVPNSYKSFGNNGNCYNLDISDETCVGQYSQSLRNNLFNMSDHLPIILQLETDKEFVLGVTDFNYNQLITLEKTFIESQLNISISEEYLDRVVFSIYNTLGQEVLQYTSNSKKNNRIDVSFLQSGLFYIKTNIPNQNVLKFIKK
jgi:hypothetical protein